MEKYSSPLEKFAGQAAPKWTDDMCGFRAIVLVVLGCCSAGFIFVLPGLDDSELKIWLGIGVSVSVAMTLVLLVLVHQVDPGIVAPSCVKDPEIIQAEQGQISPDLVIDSHGQWARRRLLLDGRSEITQRYCNTCNIWRQPRTSHCSRCGFCMERFDHHCTAVGTCIAKKNHRFFTAFLFFASLGSGLLLFGTVVRLQQEDWSRGLDGQSWETYLLLLLSLAFFYISLLFFFAIMHCTILICDCTTKEYIKSRQGRASSDWNRPSLGAWFANMRGVCCSEVRSKFNVVLFENGGPSDQKRVSPV